MNKATELWRLKDGREIEVAEPYYVTSCDGCGWVGSSEACGTDWGGDDSDVYCPTCGRGGADCGKATEGAVLVWKVKDTGGRAP